MDMLAAHTAVTRQVVPNLPVELWEKIALQNAPTELAKALELVKTYGFFKTYSITFDPSGDLFASGSFDGNKINLWSAETGELIKTLDAHTDVIKSMSFAPSGDVLASAGLDETIKLWRVETGELIKTLDEAHESAVESLTFSPSGDLIASGGRDAEVKLWNAETGELVKTFDGHSMWVLSVSFSPSGYVVASGALDN